MEKLKKKQKKTEEQKKTRSVSVESYELVEIFNCVLRKRKNGKRLTAEGAIRCRCRRSHSWPSDTRCVLNAPCGHFIFPGRERVHS